MQEAHAQLSPAKCREAYAPYLLQPSSVGLPDGPPRSDSGAASGAASPRLDPGGRLEVPERAWAVDGALRPGLERMVRRMQYERGVAVQMRYKRFGNTGDPVPAASDQQQQQQ